MNVAFEMRSLLEQAGFRIHRTRADCIKCEGSSRATVSFNAEVAHCHRCKWSANTFTLARDLGLLRGDPEARARFRREVEDRKRVNAELEKFEQWRNSRIRQASTRHRLLWRKALLAQDVLREFPDFEPAWDALARWYHAEAQLSATLDYLSFSKAGRWLETDSTREQVMEVWRKQRAAAA